MPESRTVYVVGTDCPPDQEERFNRWYDETHIPLLMKSNLLRAVTRYRLAPSATGDYPRYLAVYEFDNVQDFEAWRSSDEMKAAREEMSGTWGSNGFDIRWRIPYEPIMTWRR